MRRVNDFYPTPEFATRELLKSVSISGHVLECCAGDGAIADVLRTRAEKVFTNDIDRERKHLHFYFDAADESQWFSTYQWIVTNPPFNQAAQIVPIAYEHATAGIAMLLRLSFLEPVEDRGHWLNKHPPTRMIVLPRISFTGDGKTDSVTCAWMIWEKGKTGTIQVAENPRFQSKDVSQMELVA